MKTSADISKSNMFSSSISLLFAARRFKIQTVEIYTLQFKPAMKCWARFMETEMNWFVARSRNILRPESCDEHLQHPLLKSELSVHRTYTPTFLKRRRKNTLRIKKFDNRCITQWKTMNHIVLGTPVSPLFLLLLLLQHSLGEPQT